MVPHRHALPRAILLAAFIALLVPGPARADEVPAVFRGRTSPAAEFGQPYAIRVLPGGSVVEISGSFSWAVPQNFAAILAQAPGVRTVRLESPGGFVEPALAVANMPGPDRRGIAPGWRPCGILPRAADGA